MNILSKLTIILLTLLCTNGFARSDANAQRAASMEKYKVCDVGDIAKGLEKVGGITSVKWIEDKEANYNYYMITNRRDMNADLIRGAVCKYIMKHQCYVYWGNVANIAMIAEKQAAWFPADTSPHYMISPLITCNKLH